MTKQYRNPVMASIHETAEGLHAAGIVNKQTMSKFDDACLTPVLPLTPEEIRALQAPERAGLLRQRQHEPHQPMGTRRETSTKRVT